MNASLCTENLAMYDIRHFRKKEKRKKQKAKKTLL